MRLRVWLAFGVLSLAWGSTYLFIRVGLRHLPPGGVVALRLAIAACTITLIAIIRRQSGGPAVWPLAVTRPVLLRLALLATVNTAVPFFLISWGETTVPSGLASVLNSTVPIFSVLLAGALLHDEPLTPSRLGGVTIGFVGVVLLLSRDLGHASTAWSSIAGQLAIVLASVCYAVGAVTVRRELRGVPPMTIATYSLWIAALETGLVSTAFSRPDLGAMQGETWISVVWLGVVGSAVGYLLAFFILGSWGAARYTLVAYMAPAVGITLGVFVLGEQVDWRILAGSVLVVGGVALASSTRRRAIGKRAAKPVPEPG